MVICRTLFPAIKTTHRKTFYILAKVNERNLVCSYDRLYTGRYSSTLNKRRTIYVDWNDFKNKIKLTNFSAKYDYSKCSCKDMKLKNLIRYVLTLAAITKLSFRMSLQSNLLFFYHCPANAKLIGCKVINCKVSLPLSSYFVFVKYFLLQ